MSSSELVCELHLDPDVEEDVAEEIQNAEAAWAKVVVKGLPVGEAAFFASLMGELGSAYEEVADELLLLEKGSLKAFTRWYVNWLFHEEEEGGEDLEGEPEAVDVAKGAGWSQVKWSVQPVAKPEHGVTWQCTRCRIISKWGDAKCLGCDDPAPHASELPTAPVGMGVVVAAAAVPFTFGASSTNAPTGAISSQGFSFGGSSISSSGFSFPPASVPSAAPGLTGGFTFIPTPAAVGPTVFGAGSEESK